MFLSSGEFILGTGGKKFYQHTVTLRFEKKNPIDFKYLRNILDTVIVDVDNKDFKEFTK